MAAAAARPARGVPSAALAHLLLLVTPLGTSSVTIDNTAPRRDTHGNIINAHDGHILAINGTFWLFGTSYTHCLMTDATACLGTCGIEAKCAYPISPTALPNHPACGWTNNDFAAYSSTDLLTWRLENPSILPADQRPNGALQLGNALHPTHPPEMLKPPLTLISGRELQASTSARR